MLRFFQLLSLMALLIAVTLVSALTTMHFAIHGAEVSVPNFKAMTLTEAHRQAAGLGLELIVDNRFYSGDIPAGRIVSQSPAASTRVRREWQVRVGESLGPRKVTIPNTIGMPERVADLALRRNGLDLDMTAHMKYTGALDGTVLSQDPPANGVNVERPSVSLLIADQIAPPAPAWVMPDLMGQPGLSAQTLLERAQIPVAPLTEIDVPVAGLAPDSGTAMAPVVTPGTVVAQWPPAGNRVDRTMTVTLTVSR